MSKVNKEYLQSTINALTDFALLDSTPQNPAAQNALIEECCRILRNLCARGSVVQDSIIEISSRIDLFKALTKILHNEEDAYSKNAKKMCWQFLANLIVQNQMAQKRLWNECSSLLLSAWKCPCECGFPNEFTMILYNVFLGGTITMQCKPILEILLNCYENSSEAVKHNTNNDFSQIFLEHLISRERFVVPALGKLDFDFRYTFLHYISCHMDNHQHELIHPQLLHHICSEFKKKSDCVLKTVSSYVESIDPKEVVLLLEIIAKASSDERYGHALGNDGALFLNVGCLLQTIIKYGRNEGNEPNIFTPVQKLGQLAPSSKENSDIERDISYQLKSMLVRTLGNLAYKNTKNQNLAREMDILAAVLDSTSLDARNPCKMFN